MTNRVMYFIGFPNKHDADIMIHKGEGVTIEGLTAEIVLKHLREVDIIIEVIE